MYHREPPFDFAFRQTEVEEICQEQPFESPEWFISNESYGFCKIFKEYTGLPMEYCLRVTIEQGLKFNASGYRHGTPFDLPGVLTPSEFRARLLNEIPGLRGYAVGSPYLYGLTLFGKFGLPPIPEDQRRGTIVFPFKSTPKTNVKFDHADYARRLRALPERFQPVHVCLFWLEIQAGAHKPYLEAGVPVLSAGYRLHELFLYRFHDMCRRFRYAASNAVGSNVCLSTESGCRFFYLSGKEYDREVLVPIVNDDRVGADFERFDAEFKKLFAEPVEEITPEQRRWSDDFLGKKSFKTPAQLRRLFLKIHRLYEGLPWWSGPSRVLRPPAAETFDWSKMPPIHGWYQLEFLEKKLIRWMGREEEAWIELSWADKSGQDAVLECKLTTVPNAGLEIRVNGHLITPPLEGAEWNAEAGAFHITRKVPAAALKETLRISFRAPNRVRPCDSIPGSKEPRLLGAAVYELSLKAAGS